MLPDNMEVGWNISKNVESAYMQLTFAAVSYTHLTLPTNSRV